MWSKLTKNIVSDLIFEVLKFLYTKIIYKYLEKVKESNSVNENEQSKSTLIRREKLSFSSFLNNNNSVYLGLNNQVCHSHYYCSNKSRGPDPPLVVAFNPLYQSNIEENNDKGRHGPPPVVSVNPLDQPNIEDNEYEAPDAILG